MNPDKKVVTRFPPSPTGLLHAGNFRTAIFNYLFTRKFGGTFILRIEDTDRARSKLEFEDNILETMQWLELQYDAFYRQSDHVERHREVLMDLIEKDIAYASKEVPTEEGQRTEVIRFRNPNTTVTFTDVIRGPISIDTTDLGDFIIGRSITEPLYHFGVVVDDIDEGVTHVIRGEDGISNTPRQILIQRALGMNEPPIYAHLPLVLGPDHLKLSKRRGAKPLTQYRDEGFLPEAMINYLSLLGWHPEGKQEVFSLEELLEEFNLSRIQKSSGVFDEVKLRWFNQQHIKRLSQEEFLSRLTDFCRSQTSILPPYTATIAKLLQDRSTTLADALEALQNGEFSFMEESPLSPSSDLLLQGAKAEALNVREYLKKVLVLLAECEPFTAERVKETVYAYATKVGRASVLWPMRVALSGMEKSPDPFTLAGLLGKERTLSRIEQAIQLL